MLRTEEGSLLTEVILDIFKLNGILISEGDALSAELGLTSARWKVLGALAYSSNDMTVADIAREMGLTRQAVQRLANELQKDGLLNTKENPNHKRSNLIAMTEKGKKIYQQIDQKQIEWINKKSNGFKASELNSITKQLKLIIKSMETGD